MREYSTEDYSVGTAEKEGQQVYQVVNSDSGIIEYEDYLLPRVIDTMIEMQARLEEARKKLDFPALAPVGGTEGEHKPH
jgi:hypothetical protein